eukprot:CAMPEP_0198205606 /NCGR_PEP_ID=MMETSP1445-20131203/9144_1 /TAXON_ID=36898 /ORGANISM="Pyramimonas sp., Strain CCMP2087" /LENGTH=179 /DNA_ID=CAMNT_0043877971 /DNA_START=197 /DNA_END=733 /DNA_ORIENTATION=-
MRQRSDDGPNADKLEVEALQMESKLAELRNQMAVAREAREQLAKKHGGSMWASAQPTGRLRGHKAGSLPKTKKPSAAKEAKDVERVKQSSSAGSSDGRGNADVWIAPSSTTDGDAGEELGGMCCGGSPADEFDEDESHNSFLNALAEWRGVEVEKIKEKEKPKPKRPISGAPTYVHTME